MKALLAIIGTVVLMGSLFYWNDSREKCSARVVQSVPSPDGRMTAVLKAVRCKRYKEPDVEVWLVESPQTSDGPEYVLPETRFPGSIAWKSDHTLVLSHPNARAEKVTTEAGVTIDVEVDEQP